MFERYCNLCNSIRIPLFTNKLIESQKKKTNYSFHPDEKIMTTEEVLQSARAIDYVYAVLLHDKNLTNEFFKIITNNEIVGEPYISLTNPDEKPYYDPRILNRVTGSVGMCAGNTVEEALN